MLDWSFCFSAYSLFRKRHQSLYEPYQFGYLTLFPFGNPVTSFWGLLALFLLFPTPCLLILNVTLFSYFHTLVISLFSRKHSSLPICLKSASVIHLFFHKYLLHFFSVPVLALKSESTYWTKTHMIPILRA